MALAKQRPAKSEDAYRSIGEAARELGLPTHVLRYWETKFPRYVRPLKRPDGRRLYRRRDLDGLRAIKTLVHRRGMTLKGASALLREKGIEIVLSGDRELGDVLAGSPVHGLQRSIRDAFDKETVRPGAPDVQGLALPEGESGASGRLQAVLEGLDALKLRLDRARATRAA